MNECIWSEDEDGLWWTACKEIHEFFDGTPTENSYKFCPYCGKELKEERYREGNVGTNGLISAGIVEKRKLKY